MKTNRPFIISLICLCLIGVITIVKMRLPLQTVELHVVTTNETNTGAETLGKGDGFFKTITDEISGQYAIISLNKRVVMLKEKNGRVIWSADIITPIEKDSGFITSNHTICSMHLATNDVICGQVVSNQLVIKLEAGTLIIDKQTGKEIIGGFN
jgi:hypothetical protein